MTDTHQPRGRIIPLSTISTQAANTGTVEAIEDESPRNTTLYPGDLPAGRFPLQASPQDDLASKRSLSHHLSCPPRLSLNGLLIGLLCSLGLVALGFYPVDLTSPLSWWDRSTITSASDPATAIAYTLQFPLALFAAALLGPFMGLIAVLTYILAGLTLYPLFANGGGMHYLSQPGFGYWLGTAVASFGLSRIFHRIFIKDPVFGHKPGSCSLRLLRHSAVAILSIHVIGLIYLVLLVMAGQMSGTDLPGWALRLTLEPLPYDLLAGICLIGIVRPIRWCLWFALY